MAMLVLDRSFEEQVRADRKARGIDKYDEVWDGVYVMSPLANNEHQELAGGLVFVFQTVVAVPGLGKVCPGVNVSDREDWTHNYRCPDVVVFLQGTSAINRDTFWLGGPDFAVEILSEGDRARAKLPFYAKVGVRELLLVDRAPWALELFRLADGSLVPVGRSTLEQPDALTSEVVPLTFRLVTGEERPRIEVRQGEQGSYWFI